MIFDGHDLTSLFIVGEPQITPFSSTVQSEQLPGRDGVAVLGRDWGGASVTATVAAFGPARVRRDAFSMLARWLSVDEPKKLILPDTPDRYYMAVPDGSVDISRHIDAETAQLTFIITEPAYGTERTVSIPSGGSATFLVGGTYRTAPVIYAAAAARNNSGIWGLVLDSADVMQVQTGVATAAVSIDCVQRKSLVNGAVKLPTLASDWFELEPGTHTVRNNQGTGACTLTFRERWL